MASSSETDIPHRRWLVVGTVLNRVLMPYLRMKIQQEMTPFYQTLVANFGIDKQTYSSHQKTISTSAMKLNYESINHNAAGSRDPRCYDYCVQDEVSLAKLFMKSYMAHFNTFDSSLDASAALAVLCLCSTIHVCEAGCWTCEIWSTKWMGPLWRCIMDRREIRYMLWSNDKLGPRPRICPSRGRKTPG